MDHNTRNRFFKGLGIVIFLLWGTFAVHAQSIESSVVLITNHQQQPNWNAPWMRGYTSSSSGTGFLIENQWILTNAHVVVDSRHLLVNRISSPQPYIAHVVAFAHDSDLAILKVEDPSFYEGLVPLELGKIPDLHSRVRTYGYPSGGTTISRTEGVVSRVEFDTYLHSGVDSHLIIQTDSAINPGNSGGPVLQDGKVVGVAFQSNPNLNDVGYMIPIPLVQRFIKDMEDGTYQGVPEIGIQVSNLLNPHLRDYLKLPEGIGGVIVDRIVPQTSAEKFLQEGDVVVEIDGVSIDSAGLVDFQGHMVPFHIKAEHKQVGDRLNFRVWRENEFLDLEFELSALPNGAEFRMSYNSKPQYFIFGGMVFVPLNRNFIRSGQSSPALIYEHFYRDLEDAVEGREQTVVLTRTLPALSNEGYSNLRNFIVDQVNGIKIKSLKHLKSVVTELKDDVDFYKIESQWNPTLIVLDKEMVFKEKDVILKRYGIEKGEQW